jgi:hypothetical protein
MFDEDVPAALHHTRRNHRRGLACARSYLRLKAEREKMTSADFDLADAVLRLARAHGVDEVDSALSWITTKSPESFSVKGLEMFLIEELVHRRAERKNKSRGPGTPFRPSSESPPWFVRHTCGCAYARLGQGPVVLPCDDHESAVMGLITAHS